MESFREISLNLLKRVNKPLQFDIYVKRTEKDFTKIFRSKDVIDRERVRRYQEKGIRYFYVQENDYALYTVFVEKFGQLAVEQNERFDNEEQAEIVKELVTMVMYELLEAFNLNARSMHNAVNAVLCSIYILKNDPKGLIRIMAMMANQSYRTKHAITVCLLSVLLAMYDGIDNEKVLTNIGLGAFLSDLGLTQLTFDPEQLKELTSEQRKEVWRHPELGAKLVEGIEGMTPEALKIIREHHEQPNGEGYPMGLKDAEIYYPAKIVSIADSFASLITKRPYRNAYSAPQAIRKMEEQKGKFDSELLNKFKKMLHLA